MPLMPHGHTLVGIAFVVTMFFAVSWRYNGALLLGLTKLTMLVLLMKIMSQFVFNTLGGGMFSHPFVNINGIDVPFWIHSVAVNFKQHLPRCGYQAGRSISMTMPNNFNTMSCT